VNLSRVIRILKECQQSDGLTRHPFRFKHHPVANLEWLIWKLPGFLSTPLLYSTALVLTLFSREHPITMHMAKLSLDVLCDIQIVTGTAVIIAGMSRLSSMTAYHKQFVLDYWFLALISFWAARAGALNERTLQLAADEDEDDSATVNLVSLSEPHGSASRPASLTMQDSIETYDSWHYWTRTAALFSTLVLASAYQSIVIVQERNDWNPVETGKCYIGHDSSKYEAQYLWLAGNIFYAAYLGVLLISGCIWKDVTFIQALISRALLLHRKRISQLRVYRASWLRRPSTIRVLQVMMYLLLGFPLFMVYIFSVFVDVVAVGRSTSIWVVICYFGFATWNVYCIIDLKISNIGLVDEDEGVWGFGQVLTMSLLWLVVLGIGDSWRGEFALLC